MPEFICPKCGEELIQLTSPPSSDEIDITARLLHFEKFQKERGDRYGAEVLHRARLELEENDKAINDLQCALDEANELVESHYTRFVKAQDRSTHFMRQLDDPKRCARVVAQTCGLDKRVLHKLAQDEYMPLDNFVDLLDDNDDSTR